MVSLNSVCDALRQNGDYKRVNNTKMNGCQLWDTL